MAARPTWQGHLKLSLVTCPVALYSGTSTSSGVSFNLINPETGNRINMVPTDPDTGPVARSELVKGYAIDKGLYVTVTDEELDAVKAERSRTIEVERFVPEAEIDRLYWDSPYFLAPDGKMAQEAFAVIREAMREQGQVALARGVLSSKERLFALEPRGRGIIAHTLRTADEVRDCEEVFRQIDEVELNPSMVSIAKQILAQHEGPFDPTQFRDRYADAVMAMIEAKRSGARPSVKREPDEREVLDLMDALKRSLTPAPEPRSWRSGEGKDAEQPPARPQKIGARKSRREGADAPQS